MGRRIRTWEEAVKELIFQINPETNCWTVLNRSSKHGRYMKLQAGKTRVLLHRLFYWGFVGPIPEGYLVCHHCDNPSCVNPDHLFVGTTSDNMKDMVSKGRYRGGRKALPDNIVSLIEIEIEKGKTQKEIAKKFHISTKTHGKIRRKYLESTKRDLQEGRIDRGGHLPLQQFRNGGESGGELQSLPPDD